MNLPYLVVLVRAQSCSTFDYVVAKLRLVDQLKAGKILRQVKLGQSAKTLANEKEEVEG